MNDMKIYLDIETYSTTDLKKSGVYRYSEDAEFEVMLLAYAIGDSPVTVVEGPEACAEAARQLIEGTNHTLCAHNANFDRVCLSRVLGLPTGTYLDPSRWDDIAARAAEWGMARSLGELAKQLRVVGKMDEGSALINLFCSPSPKNWKIDRATAQTHPEKWQTFREYVARDVEALRAVDQKLPQFPTQVERVAWEQDARLNDRGVPVDVPMMRAAVDFNEKAKAKSLADAAELLQVENPNSVQQFREALAERTGLDLPDLTKETVELALETATGDAKRALELRQLFSGSAVAKYAAGLRQVSEDSLLRGSVMFFGAHTGRFTGRGIQLQNLPNAALSNGVDELARADLMNLGMSNPATLKALVRAVVPGPVTVVDYSAIEARVTAWVAGEQRVLDAFRAGHDVYTETARWVGLFDGEGNPNRKLGKIVVLACGYQGGAEAARRFGGTGTDEELWDLVNKWRNQHQNIVSFWKRLGSTIDRGGIVNNKIKVHMTGHPGRAVQLPSGRYIVYCGYRRGSGKQNPSSYLRDGRYRVGIYGGKATENVVQAIARDLLVEALQRLEAAGYDILFHVHDEVVIKGEHDPAEIGRIMCEIPSWADDNLPLAAEGAVLRRYGKA